MSCAVRMEERDWSHLYSLLTHESGVWESPGYIIIDNFLSPDWASSLLRECQRLRKDGFAQHRFKFGNEFYEKPNIYEIDLEDERSREGSAELSYLYSHAAPELVLCLKSTFPSLNLENRQPAIKMQYNSGNGGCFPFHYDNPGPPSRRQLTCVVYLNPDWVEGDGGEIVLWPFLQQPVTISPRMNRAVLFRSDLILHRVLPSTKERYCFTIWCDGATVNGNNDVLLTRDNLQYPTYDSAVAFFQSSPLQRVLSRAVYDREYEDSLMQCVGGTVGETPMIAQHRSSVAAIEAKLKPLIDEFRRRKDAMHLGI
jgi:hypothetical protein